jgi:hypothetical protein
MDAKKLLTGVATIAVGYMLGLWAYKSFMSGMSQTTPTPTLADIPTDEEVATFGMGGYDY